jgi:CheY-like chemotaxis protein
MAHHAAFGMGVEDLDVMIIEESRTAQNMLRSMLAGAGAKRIRSSDNVTEALQTMIAEPPNLVLTAWDIGKYTGEKLLKVIRHKRMEPLCYLPVIVVTAHASLRVVDQAFSAGCTSLLVKPISPQALLRRVDWVTHDEREFVEDGNSLAISGVQDVLDSRVRKRKLSTVIASNSAVDALLNGDIDRVLDDYEDMAALNADPVAKALVQKPADQPVKEQPLNEPGEQSGKTIRQGAAVKISGDADASFASDDAADEGASKPYWYGWDIGGDEEGGDEPQAPPSRKRATRKAA